MMTEMQGTDITGLILAGGLSRRMGGGDKTLIEVDGKTLLARTVERLAPQVSTLVLNANGDPARFASYGLRVVADVVDGYGGPLVGTLSGLEALPPGTEWMLTTAADTPLFPEDLAARLLEAATAQGTRLAMATCGGRAQPVFALWHASLAAPLRQAVVEGGVRKIEDFTDRHAPARVDWPNQPFDPFFNVNAPEDVVRLRMILDGTLPELPPIHRALELAVVVERKDGAGPWASESWRPLEMVLDPPPGAGWVQLRREPGWEHYLAAGRLDLHRSDLSSYRYNLAGEQPRLFVALRREEGRVRVLLVTLAPDEAQKFMESGDDVVEAVALPAAIRAWAEEFCACHPPEEPLRKRRRDAVEAGRAQVRDR